MIAFKQVYYGKVIYPATVVPLSNGDGYFLNFKVYVDNAVVDQRDRRKRSSLKLTVSVPIRKDLQKNIAAILLTNIYNEKAENANEANLAGHRYKSVDVIVSGTPEFIDAGDGKYWLTLTGATVSITDKSLTKLCKEALGQVSQGTEADQGYTSEEDPSRFGSTVPTQAPVGAQRQAPPPRQHQPQGPQPRAPQRASQHTTKPLPMASGRSAPSYSPVQQQAPECQEYQEYQEYQEFVDEYGQPLQNPVDQVVKQQYVQQSAQQQQQQIPRKQQAHVTNVQQGIDPALMALRKNSVVVSNSSAGVRPAANLKSPVRQLLEGEIEELPGSQDPRFPKQNNPLG